MEVNPMKVSGLIIILSALAAVAAVILRWNNTFAGRFGLGGEYFLKSAVRDSYAIFLLLFILPFIFAVTNKLSKRNGLITLICGIAASACGVYLVINNPATATYLFLTAGAGLAAGGLTRILGKVK
jgi:uncharacterized membrane-anchored protein YitT (DUF2179 family)